MSTIQTIPLPVIRSGKREPEGSGNLPEPSIATPCPPWCDQHSTGTPGCSGDRTTVHEAPRAIVNTTFSSGPNEPTSTHNEVQVWVERFDLDEEQDGHPVVGYPVPHLMLDQTHDVGMTAEQAERIGRALLDSAAKVRTETARLSGTGQLATAEAAEAWLAGYNEGARPPSPVWPPETCPGWCSYADDPAKHNEGHGPVPQDDRTHLHSCYVCVPGADPNSDGPEPGDVELSLEPVDRYLAGGEHKTVHQVISPEMSLHYREVEPRVRMGRLGVYEMTLDEAEQLADLLAHLVELGRRG